MGINVTHLVNGSEDMFNFSASAFELGENAGEITWTNAVSYSEEAPLVTEDQLDDVAEWLKDFGAWPEDEIDDMVPTELNALLLQFVAGDIREMQDFDSEDEYLDAGAAGQNPGRLYKGDDDQWYFSIEG